MLGDALSYVADSLQKPGRAVRGLLTGNLREGLAAVPFSDSMGITDPSQAVSGRHLTDKMGLTRSGDKGWGSWMVGMGADMATDPLSYLPAHSVFKMLKPGMAAEHGLTTAPSARSVRSMIQPSLGLKYDNLAQPPSGMLRSHPEWVNNKTFYHGSGTPGVTASALDPMKTDPYNLFGRGIYTTADRVVGSEYMEKGVEDASKKVIAELQNNQDFMRGALERASRGEFDDFLKGYGEHYAQVFDHKRNPVESMRPTVKRQEMHNLSERYLTPHLRGGMKDVPSDVLKEAFNLYAPGVKASAPSLYQSQSSFKNILDVEQELSPDKYQQLFNSFNPIKEATERKYPGFWRDVVDDLTPTVNPREPEGLLRHLIKLAGVDPDRDLMLHGIRNAGYDAITHTGGVRVGDHTHQVVIGLDPNDVLGLGSKSPYQKWEQVNAALHSNGSGSLSPGGSLGRALEAVQGPAVHGGNVSAGGLGTRLRSLRENIPVFKNYPHDQRVVGTGKWSPRQIVDAVKDHREITREVPGLEGVSVSPWHHAESAAAGTAAVYHPSAAREEILHAMVGKAAFENRIGELPVLSRPAAWLQRQGNLRDSDTLRGLGSIMDEFAAKTLAERGLGRRIGAAANFAFDPKTHGLYDPQFAAHGLAPRLAYHTLPYALPAGVGAGAGYALMGGD